MFLTEEVLTRLDTQDAENGTLTPEREGAVAHGQFWRQVDELTGAVIGYVFRTPESQLVNNQAAFIWYLESQETGAIVEVSIEERAKDVVGHYYLRHLRVEHPGKA